MTKVVFLALAVCRYTAKELMVYTHRDTENRKSYDNQRSSGRCSYSRECLLSRGKKGPQSGCYTVIQHRLCSGPARNCGTKMRAEHVCMLHMRGRVTHAAVSLPDSQGSFSGEPPANIVGTLILMVSRYGIP